MSRSINRRQAILAAATVGVAAALAAGPAATAEPGVDAIAAAAPGGEAGDYHVQVLNFLPNVERGGRKSVLGVRENTPVEFRSWFKPGGRPDVLLIPDANPPKDGDAAAAAEGAKELEGRRGLETAPQLTLRVERISETHVLLDTSLSVVAVGEHDPKTRVLRARTITLREVRPVAIGEEVALSSPDDKAANAADPLFKLTVTKRAQPGA